MWRNGKDQRREGKARSKNEHTQRQEEWSKMLREEAKAKIPKQYTLVNALLRVFILNMLHVLWCSGSHTSPRKWIPIKRTVTPLRCKIYLLAEAYINHPPNYTHNITDTRAKQQDGQDIFTDGSLTTKICQSTQYVLWCGSYLVQSTHTLLFTN